MHLLVCRWALGSPPASSTPHLQGKIVVGPGTRASCPPGSAGLLGEAPRTQAEAGSPPRTRRRSRALQGTETCAYSDSFSKTGPTFGVKPSRVLQWRRRSAVSS